MSSSAHVDNKEKAILILGECPTQGLDDTTLTTEKKYSFNFTVTRKKFGLSLHYNRANEYFFVNGRKIIFKAKDSEIVATPLRLGNISKDFSKYTMKKTKSYRVLHDFSVDYDAVSVDDIRHSQVFNEKEWYSINKVFGFIKQIFVTAMMFFTCNAFKA